MAYTFYKAYRVSLEAMTATRSNKELGELAQTITITLSLDDVCQGTAVVAQTLNLYDHAKGNSKVKGIAEELLGEILKYMDKHAPSLYKDVSRGLRNKIISMSDRDLSDEESAVERARLALLQRLRLSRDKTKTYRAGSRSSSSEKSSGVQNVSSTDESSSREQISPHSP